MSKSKRYLISVVAEDGRQADGDTVFFLYSPQFGVMQHSPQTKQKYVWCSRLCAIACQKYSVHLIRTVLHCVLCGWCDVGEWRLSI